MKGATKAPFVVFTALRGGRLVIYTFILCDCIAGFTNEWGICEKYFKCNTVKQIAQ